MDKALSELSIWQDPWLSQFKITTEIEVAQFAKTRRKQMKTLGVERDDLMQGVLLRFSKLKKRIEDGEFDSEKATERTWVSSQIKWAMEDTLRGYGWAKNIVRKQQERYMTNEKFVPFFILQIEEIDAESEDHKYIDYGYIDDIIGRTHVNHILEMMDKRLLKYSAMNREIFFKYYRDGRTMKDIGTDYKITESRICQRLRQMRLGVINYVKARCETQIPRLFTEENSQSQSS